MAIFPVGLIGQEDVESKYAHKISCISANYYRIPHFNPTRLVYDGSTYFLIDCNKVNNSLKLITPIQ